MNKDLALEDAIELIDAIMKGEINPEDECEKWLRAYAPKRLRDATSHDKDKIAEHNVRIIHIMQKINWLEGQWDRNDNNNKCNKFVQDKLTKLHTELTKLQTKDE